MKKAVKVGDKGTGHDGFPETVVISGSPDVYIEGMPAARVGDDLAPHSKPKHPPHKRTITSGAPGVYINGKRAAIDGGSISCGGVTIGSGGVFIGDGSAPPSEVNDFSNLFDHSDSEPNSEPSTPKPTPVMEPDNLYWPPYNPLAGKGGQHLDVEFTQKAVELAVLSLEEAEEFANNLWTDLTGEDTSEKSKYIGQLWSDYQVKEKLDSSKKLWDGAAHARDAQQLAKGLGGLGVIVYVKQVDGKDYVILKGYKKHLKTLVKGHRWRANNPQVIQLGLGSKNMARNLLKVGLVVDITFSVAINAVDTILHDEKTMVDFVGNSGADIAKGMIATGVGTVVAIAVASSLPIVAVGTLFAGVTVLSGIGLEAVDKHYGVADSFIEAMKGVNP